MDNSQEKAPAGGSVSMCNLCGKSEGVIYVEVCENCVRETLIKFLPRLKRVLEDKFGESLDGWLAKGHFLNAKWRVEDNFQINKARLKDFLRAVIKDGISDDKIKLDLATDELWQPTRIDDVMEHIYERCINEFELLIKDSIFKALGTAPTIEAERELIEVASGTKRVRKRYIREHAISTILLSDSNILPFPVRVLVELRYRADGGRAHYTELAEGLISSIWREIEESLPEEVVKLIVEDNSF